jgi:predicted nucleotidyltransferase
MALGIKRCLLLNRALSAMMNLLQKDTHLRTGRWFLSIAANKVVSAVLMADYNVLKIKRLLNCKVKTLKMKDYLILFSTIHLAKTRELHQMDMDFAKIVNATLMDPDVNLAKQTLIQRNVGLTIEWSLIYLN